MATVQALDHLAVPCVRLDGSGRIVWANEAFRRISGPAAEPGPEFLALFDRDDRDDVRRSLEGDTGVSRDVALVTAEGKVMRVLVAADPAEGLVVLVPVDHLVERERAARSALESERQRVAGLESAARMKDTLLSAVSHELRSPLAIVSGFALVLDKDLERLTTPEIRHLVGRIMRQAQHLDRLLTDLLDTRRLAQGLVEPLRRSIDVRFIVEDVVRSSDLGSRTVSIEAKNARASVDPAMVERMVENMLGNVARYTPADSHVWVSVKPDSGGVLIEVSDDGLGIPDDLKERVFEAFVQAQEGGPGTGLGLSLVAEFARLHGGRAWVTDRAGGGASFHVYIPDGEASSEEAELAER